MCRHGSIIGDNYGETCTICGEVLSGYGYWAEGSKECRHRWLPETQDSKYEVCMYCEGIRLKEAYNSA